VDCDQRRRRYGAATATGYLRLWQQWCIDYVPMMMLSSSLCLALLRWPALFSSRRNVLAWFIVVMVLFQPLQWLYLDWVRSGDALSLHSVYQARLRMRRFRLVRHRRHVCDHRRHRQLAAGTGARGRWNSNACWPCARSWSRTIFNALNAISALVREGDKAVSLQGISRLSDLLRYALSASLRDAVSLGEELQFVHDYTALQRLRYGERLQINIDGDGDAAQLHDVPCPPLLLQPLIENALRHDLDSHRAAAISVCRSRSRPACCCSLSPTPSTRTRTPIPAPGWD
jgi:hypothetical protein